MEKKLKHLEFIQKTIERMAKNSFLLKGWSLTLTTALIAISVKEKNMYKVNNNKHLTKKHNICIGSHEEQHLLFSLVHLILC